jgi:hypothetical protein
MDRTFERNGNSYKIDGKEVSKEVWEAQLAVEREKEEEREEAEEAEVSDAEDDRPGHS